MPACTRRRISLNCIHRYPERRPAWVRRAEQRQQGISRTFPSRVSTQFPLSTSTMVTCERDVHRRRSRLATRGQRTRHEANRDDERKGPHLRPEEGMNLIGRAGGRRTRQYGTVLRAGDQEKSLGLPSDTSLLRSTRDPFLGDTSAVPRANLSSRSFGHDLRRTDPTPQRNSWSWFSVTTRSNASTWSGRGGPSSAATSHVEAVLCSRGDVRRQLREDVSNILGEGRCDRPPPRERCAVVIHLRQCEDLFRHKAHRG